MDRNISRDELSGSPQLDTAILPTFQKYKQENESWSPDFDIWDYLNMRADLDLAAAFTKLFWPDFIEVDGCVLLKCAYSPESFRNWMDNYKGDKRAVEAMVNHTHIRDLFLNPPKDVENIDQLSEYLAGALMFGWKQALQSSYPDKRFVFTLGHSYGPEISFHQAESLAAG